METAYHRWLRCWLMIVDSCWRMYSGNVHCLFFISWGGCAIIDKQPWNFYVRQNTIKANIQHMSTITNWTAIRICLLILHLTFFFASFTWRPTDGCVFVYILWISFNFYSLHVCVVFHFCWQNCSCWDHYTEELWISCKRQTIKMKINASYKTQTRMRASHIL